MLRRFDGRPLRMSACRPFPPLIAFPDPAAAKGSDGDIMKVFRRVRDDIRTKFTDDYRREISKTLPPQ